MKQLSFKGPELSSYLLLVLSQMFPLYSSCLTTTTVSILPQLLSFFFMFFLLCDSFPNLLFPSRSLSWAFSIYFHTQNFIALLCLFILKTCPCHLIIKFVNFPSRCLSLNTLCFFHFLHFFF